MIDTMTGNQEIIQYRKKSLVRFDDNTDNESYPPHWHNWMEIIMPVENGYTVVSNGVAYHLRRDDILIIQPNVLHRMPAMPGRRFICQASLLPIYSLELYKSLNSLLPSTLLLTAEQDESLWARVQEQLKCIFNEYNSISQTAELAMYVGILQILLLISRDEVKNFSGECGKDINKQTHINFLSICEYINNHYADKLTLEDVARKSGYSKYHFERLFKNYTSETFYQYLNKVRIKNAECLIMEHDISITEAAYKSGFSTISSFIRMFKLHNNCTPSEFRSAQR
jgi:AraC-like DNA-binding protein